MTYQQVKINKLPEGKDIQYGDGEMYLHREGESMYTFYLPEWKGVNPETGLGEFWKILMITARVLSIIMLKQVKV